MRENLQKRVVYKQAEKDSNFIGRTPISSGKGPNALNMENSKR